MKRSKTLRNGEQSGTPRNVRVGTQSRYGTNRGKRSRSRSKNERITVIRSYNNKILNMR
jgi:hypothetical protein